MGCVLGNTNINKIHRIKTQHNDNIQNIKYNINSRGYLFTSREFNDPEDLSEIKSSEYYDSNCYLETKKLNDNDKIKNNKNCLSISHVAQDIDDKINSLTANTNIINSRNNNSISGNNDNDNNNNNNNNNNNIKKITKFFDKYHFLYIKSN